MEESDTYSKETLRSFWSVEENLGKWSGNLFKTLSVEHRSLNSLFQSHKMALSSEEITAVKRNLQMAKIDVDTDFVSFCNSFLKIVSILDTKLIYLSLKSLKNYDIDYWNFRYWLFEHLILIILTFNIYYLTFDIDYFFEERQIKENVYHKQ